MTKTKLPKETIIEMVNERLDKKLEALSIDAVNFKPHPYVISSGHVGYASDRGGSMSEYNIEAYEKTGGHCAYPGCRIPYRDHKYDTVLFLQLLQNVPEKEGKRLLKRIGGLLETNNIDGIVLVENGSADYKFTK